MKLIIVAEVDVPFTKTPDKFNMELVSDGGRVSRELNLHIDSGGILYMTDRFTSSKR